MSPREEREVLAVMKKVSKTLDDISKALNQMAFEAMETSEKYEYLTLADVAKRQMTKKDDNNGK